MSHAPRSCSCSRLVATFLALLGVCGAARAATISVPSVLRGGTGRDVVVPIRLSPTDGVTDLSLSLGYDASVLQPTGVFRSGLTHAASLFSDLTTPGVVGITLSGASGAPGPVGDMAWVNFRLVGPVSSSSPLTWGSVVLNGGGVPVTTVAGQVSVISASAVVSIPDDSSGVPGASVVVPISVAPASGGEAFDLSVRFDPNVIAAVQVAKTTLSNPLNLTANLSTPGEVRISLFRTSPITGSGAMALITFHVVGVLGERTPLDVFRGDVNEGGISTLIDDGAFTVCTSADADGDGFSGCAGDCNDSIATTHPGAPETCDGLDNDCDGSIDDGIGAPAGRPLVVLARTPTAAQISWPAVASSSGYDVVRGSLDVLASSAGDFSTSTHTCLGNDIPTLVVSDSDQPAGGFWYLVRAISCGGSGSYDTTSPHQAGGRDAEVSASPNACP